MNGEHVDQTDQLVSLLRGDADRAETAAVTAHLRECERCRGALVELLPAHAGLTAAARLLRARTPQVAGEPSSRPGGSSDLADAGQPGAAGVADDDALPPLDRPARRRPSRRAVALVAAVAVLAVGGLVGVGVDRLIGGPGGPGPAARSVALAPVVGDATGRVTMAEQSGEPVTTMSITTTGLSSPQAGQFYYAWLFDPQTNKMLPLGVVNPGDATRFQVSDDLVSRYHAVDISLQDDNGDPAHSDTSVLRASY